MLLYSLNSCATSKFYFCIVKKRIKKEKNCIKNSFRIICNLEKSFHSLVSQVVQCHASLIISLYSMSKSQHDYLNTVYCLAIPNYTYIRDKNPLSLEDLMLVYRELATCREVHMEKKNLGHSFSSRSFVFA